VDQDEIKDDVAKLALPLLVERLGGTVEITEAEYDAFVERHGRRSAGVKIERTEAGLRLTIIHTERPPLS
jgi:hypothetical protein